MGYVKARVPSFSYSKLNTYESCGWKYFLTYQEGHYIFSDSLASELGTTLHFIEQHIAEKLRAGEPIDYNKFIEDFKNINIPKVGMEGGVYGINLLKEKYKEEFIKPDDNGASYLTKTQDYIDFGIYRLEQYLKDNPDLEVFDMEKYFSVDFSGHMLSGFIDRIFHNKANDSYIIEDIKTKGKPFKDTELVTPLQFVVYTYALSKTLNIPYDKISCVYDLPFCGLKQPAGTSKYMERGIKKLSNIFNGIEQKEFVPSPTPLCAWCSFSPTNPNQPEEGKHLCPYYSLWTRENKTFRVANEWRGIEFHDEIMQKEIAKGE